MSIIPVLQVKICSNDKNGVKNTPCPNCTGYLENHSNEQIIICANAELKKLIPLESDSTPKSSEETPTGGFML